MTGPEILLEEKSPSGNPVRGKYSHEKQIVHAVTANRIILSSFRNVS
jgi:hypothetical protein